MCVWEESQTWMNKNLMAAFVDCRWEWSRFSRNITSVLGFQLYQNQCFHFLKENTNGKHLKKLYTHVLLLFVDMILRSLLLGLWTDLLWGWRHWFPWRTGSQHQLKDLPTVVASGCSLIPLFLCFPCFSSTCDGLPFLTWLCVLAVIISCLQLSAGEKLLLIWSSGNKVTLCLLCLLSWYIVLFSAQHSGQRHVETLGCGGFCLLLSPKRAGGAEQGRSVCH